MTRIILVALVVLGCIADSQANFHCQDTPNAVYPKEVCHIPACTNAIKGQIKEEFAAAFKYLHMGAYFAQDSVARPGMAKFMFDSASEERSHGILMMDYLNKRGAKITRDESFSFTLKNLTEQEKEDISVLSGLQRALKMEILVTDLIYNIIKACEHDYHGADVFTDPILDEQHDGIRKLQGAIRDFENLLHGHGDDGIAMVEFLFDQKLLKESL